VNVVEFVLYLVDSGVITVDLGVTVDEFNETAAECGVSIVE